MSLASPKRHDYDDRQDAELSRWPGVTWSRQIRGKHYAIVLTYGGVSRFVTYPCTPGDTVRGALNHIHDLRLVLTALGAERSVEVKSLAPRRHRNRTETVSFGPVEHISGGPMRDPWEALRGVTVTATVPVPAPTVAPPKLSLWRRVVALLIGKRTTSADGGALR
jgi:hypothetical protein